MPCSGSEADCFLSSAMSGRRCVRHDLLDEPARILVVEVGDVAADANGVANPVSAYLARRGAAYGLHLVDRVCLAVVPLDGQWAHMAVLVHAGGDAHVSLHPSGDALNHSHRLPQEPDWVDGIVALDVEAGHNVVGELDSPLDARVPEADAQCVDGEVEPFHSHDFRSAPEEVALHGYIHRHEVGDAHVDRPQGVILVEGLVGAQKPHGEIGDVPCKACRTRTVVCLE